MADGGHILFGSGIDFTAAAAATATATATAAAVVRQLIKLYIPHFLDRFTRGVVPHHVNPPELSPILTPVVPPPTPIGTTEPLTLPQNRLLPTWKPRICPTLQQLCSNLQQYCPTLQQYRTTYLRIHTQILDRHSQPLTQIILLANHQ